MPSDKSIILISWDGKSQPLSHVHIDAHPNFDLILFDYSGIHPHDQSMDVVRNGFGFVTTVLSKKTECKGDLFQVLGDYIEHLSIAPSAYISLIDDDVMISIADINRALHIAEVSNIDVFSPVLTHDSFFSHRWMLQQPHNQIRPVKWVEVMCPFYKSDIFMAASPYFKGFTSSWGFDKYLFPTIQKIYKRNNTALLDCIAATHLRPITSQEKRFSNGMTAAEEMHVIKDMCIRLIQDKQPDLTNTDWYKSIFMQKNHYSYWEKHLYQLGRPIKRWLAKSA